MSLRICNDKMGDIMKSTKLTRFLGLELYKTYGFTAKASASMETIQDCLDILQILKNNKKIYPKIEKVQDLLKEIKIIVEKFKFD